MKFISLFIEQPSYIHLNSAPKLIVTLSVGLMLKLIRILTFTDSRHLIRVHFLTLTRITLKLILIPILIYQEIFQNGKNFH